MPYVNPGYDSVARIPFHKASDGPDGIKGIYCVECYTRYPCNVASTRDFASKAYAAAREQHAKDPNDWAAILQAADAFKIAERNDYHPYDYDVPMDKRGYQNPVYIYDVPDIDYAPTAVPCAECSEPLARTMVGWAHAATSDGTRNYDHTARPPGTV